MRNSVFDSITPLKRKAFNSLFLGFLFIFLFIACLIASFFLANERNEWLLRTIGGALSFFFFLISSYAFYFYVSLRHMLSFLEESKKSPKSLETNCVVRYGKEITYRKEIVLRETFLSEGKEIRLPVGLMQEPPLNESLSLETEENVLTGWEKKDE